MLGRYGPRDDKPRDRGDSHERDWGSRGGERADGRGDEGGVCTRHVDLPRGPEREIVRERKRSYELNGREAEVLELSRCRRRATTRARAAAGARAFVTPALMDHGPPFGNLAAFTERQCCVLVPGARDDALVIRYSRF